ncbi:hypothetical protein NA57DRAFT_51603 [Rhizodiscina lignyota]|uniref:F-box domain-containing protein n=1 Tax=Rhizodiscina lignyota TaxID=1504668 RepID=A0A9P4MEU1_9PEZI|nr:hypothetical protein NA57DRAFT_51603 [Rhizodiscina lignyota]
MATLEHPAVSNEEEKKKKTCDSLPDELLLQVFSHLELSEGSPPSMRKFDQEPSFHLTSAPETPLKDLSTVCQRWRRILLPQLFEYSRIKLSSCSEWLVFSEDLLRYCRHHINGRPGRTENEDDIIRSLELFLDGSVPFSPDRNALPIRLIRQNDSYMRKSPKHFRKWIPCTDGTVSDFLSFVAQKDISKYVKSLVVLAGTAMEDFSEIPYNCAAREVENLWRTVFGALKPERVVVVAPPATMALLAESRMATTQAWAFEMPYHYLEFSKPRILDNPANSPDSGRRKSPSSPYHLCLHNCLNWTHLSYNEGSSVPAYALYEYFNYAPPQILYHILLWISKELQTPSRVGLESLKLVSIFPFGRHVGDMLGPLTSMKTLKSLELKLSPDKDSDVLDDNRMGKADRNDCWQELNRSYSAVVSFLRKMRPETGFELKVQDYTWETLEQELDRILGQLANWRKESGKIWTPP